MKGAERYRIGDLVLLSRDREGVIKYVGYVNFSDKIHCGIELCEGTVGNTDGEKNGHRYFAVMRLESRSAYPFEADSASSSRKRPFHDAEAEAQELPETDGQRKPPETDQQSDRGVLGADSADGFESALRRRRCPAVSVVAEWTVSVPATTERAPARECHLELGAIDAVRRVHIAMQREKDHSLELAVETQGERRSRSGEPRQNEKGAESECGDGDEAK